MFSNSLAILQIAFSTKILGASFIPALVKGLCNSTKENSGTLVAMISVNCVLTDFTS